MGEWTTGPREEPVTSLMEGAVTPTLLGYEVMEERSKFTVYKILVSSGRGSSWVVFRRYADFSRLSEKLKEMFPRLQADLPPKRWLGDNYDTRFLEDRLMGLKTFLQKLAVHQDIIRSEAFRQFLCVKAPMGPFDSLVESRALCETLEETNHRLRRELVEKQREVDFLKRTLEDKDNHIRSLKEKAKCRNAV